MNSAVFPAVGHLASQEACRSLRRDTLLSRPQGRRREAKQPGQCPRRRGAYGLCWPLPPHPCSPLTLLLDQKLEEEVDTLAGVALGDFVLVPPQQCQQAYLAAQHGGQGLFLGRVCSEQSQARPPGVMSTVPPSFPALNLFLSRHLVGKAPAQHLTRGSCSRSGKALHLPDPGPLICKSQWSIASDRKLAALLPSLPCVHACTYVLILGALRFFSCLPLYFSSFGCDLLWCSFLCVCPIWGPLMFLKPWVYIFHQI